MKTVRLDNSSASMDYRTAGNAIRGGTFRMGSDKQYPEGTPVHRVIVDSFIFDQTPVTNRHFKQFVKATRSRHVRRNQLAFTWTLLAAHDRAPFKFNGKVDRLKINYLPQCRLTEKRRGHE